MLKFFAFDMDGALVDSEPLKALAHSWTVREHGSHVDPTYYMDVLGQSFELVAKSFLTKGGGIRCDLADYRQAYKRYYKTLIEEESALLPCVADRLEGLRGAGTSLALVTSSERWMTNSLLRRLKVLEFFDTLVCSEDVFRKKPHPDAYLLAAARLNRQPGEGVAVEDSTPGISAAVAAGMRVFAVRHSYNGTQDLSTAERTFDSLCDFELKAMTNL